MRPWDHQARMAGEPGLYVVEWNLSRGEGLDKEFRDWGGALQLGNHWLGIGAGNIVRYIYVYPKGTTVQEAEEQVPAILDILRVHGAKIADRLYRDRQDEFKPFEGEKA